jgi:hypothetical protein
MPKASTVIYFGSAIAMGMLLASAGLTIVNWTYWGVMGCLAAMLLTVNK